MRDGEPSACGVLSVKLVFTDAKLEKIGRFRPALRAAIEAWPERDNGYTSMTVAEFHTLNKQNKEQAVQASKCRVNPALPSLGKMAGNLVKSAGTAIHAAVRGKTALRTVDEVQGCMALCESCEFFRLSDRRCSKCGCRAQWKARLANWHCPLPEPKW